MKLCKDCKYFAEASNKEAFCLHSESLNYDDPVYGDHSQKTCREMRLGNYNESGSNNGKCGKIGKLWIAAADFTPMEFETK